MNGHDENVSPVGKPNGGGGGYLGGGDRNLNQLYDKVHQMDLRLVKVEERLKHVPTKAWVRGGVITGIVTGTALALAILKLFDT